MPCSDLISFSKLIVTLNNSGWLLPYNDTHGTMIDFNENEEEDYAYDCQYYYIII